MASPRTDWGSGVKMLTRPTAPAWCTTCPRRSRRTAWMWTRRGEYIVAGGKLATVIPVHSFSKMQKAIADKAFDERGEGHSGAQVRGDRRRRGAEARARTAAHRVRRQGLRLHLDVHLLGDREVEPRGLQGEGPGADLLLDRPPHDSRRRQPEAVRQVRGRAQQDHQGPLPAHRPGARPVGPALRHHRRPDEAAARLPDHRRAALRPGAAGERDPGSSAQDVSADGEQGSLRLQVGEDHPAWSGRGTRCTSS